MDRYHVDFDRMPWESPIEGMRQKVFKSGTRRIRLVEYTPQMEPHWCAKGHFGCVLDGRLEIEFGEGTWTFEPGDGVFIPDGEEHRHRARILTDVARVIFVEDA
jgi:quercetin dioxygenase-like cupin family protein